MRRIKSRDTSLERKVRCAVHRRGLRFRLNRNLPGKPDIVFVAARVVVFLDSCFWHGCDIHLRMPHSNVDYWKQKIQRNIQRDALVSKEYEQSEWKMLRFWEHELKSDFEQCIDKIEQTVRSPRID